MNFKKWTALLMAVVLLFAFSACGVQGWQDPESGETASDEVSSAPVVTADDYEDSLQGLCDYFAAQDYVKGDKTDMEAQVIGASAGVKYSFVVSNVTVNLELYEFDLENLNDTGKGTVESVKTNGYFTLLGTDVEAVLSDNGKYLMIYAEAKEKDEVAAQKETVTAEFKAFKA